MNRNLYIKPLCTVIASYPTQVPTWSKYVKDDDEEDEEEEVITSNNW